LHLFYKSITNEIIKVNYTTNSTLGKTVPHSVKRDAKQKIPLFLAKWASFPVKLF